MIESFIGYKPFWETGSSVHDIEEKELHAAVEVLACGKLLYHLGYVRRKLGTHRHEMAKADAYLQRGLGVSLSSDLDSFVQATLLASMALYLREKQGTTKEESMWKRDA